MFIFKSVCKCLWVWALREHLDLMGIGIVIQQHIKSSVCFYVWVVMVILMGLDMLTSKQFLSQGLRLLHDIKCLRLTI